MPCGSVRVDLDKTGTNYRHGNPVPATNSSYNSNPIPQTDASWKSNPVPATDATFNTNPVNWTPSPSHFGNSINPGN